MSILCLPTDILNGLVNVISSSPPTPLPLYTIKTRRSSKFGLTGRQTTVSTHDSGEDVFQIYWSARALAVLGEKAAITDVKLGTGKLPGSKLWVWKEQQYEIHRPGSSWKVLSINSGQTVASMSFQYHLTEGSRGHTVRLSQSLDREQGLFVLLIFIYTEARWAENNSAYRVGRHGDAMF